MSGIVRQLAHEVSFNGTVLANVLSYSWSLGYDLAVGEAVVRLPIVSTAGTYYDDVTISVNGVPRWSGVLVEWNYALYPRAVTMVCRGRLQFAQQYRLEGEVDPDEGLALADLLGAFSGTDEQIVQAVLDRAGVSTNGGSIGGTGTVLGTVAPEEFTWREGESALDYIHRIDTISLGYRTFETAGGQIFRSQISSRPSGSPDLTFTEGVDISDGSSARTVREAHNAARVGGYAVGDFADPRVWYEVSSNPFQSESNPRVFNMTNPMIERKSEASAGQGISCEAMANYWLGELNREVVHVTMTTPRTDLIGPGQVHLVQGPGGAADRLGTGEKLWVQRNNGNLDQSGAFSQTMQYIGGGAD